MTYYGFVMPMRYPKYKQSQIDWLGEIPQEWKITKLKFSDLVIMGQSPDSEDYNYQNSGLPFLQGNAEFTDLYPKPVVWCEKANKIAIEKDVLLSVRAPIGAVNIADQKYGIGRGLCAIRCKKSYYRFVYYQLLVAEQELNSIGTGSTYTAISVDDVKNLMLALPSKDEQIQISKYLDNQLLKINKILDRDIQLIKLLNEKRTTIINNLITQGFETKEKLVNSSTKWFSKMPKGWELKKLKYLAIERKEKAVSSKSNTLYIGLENIESSTGKLINYGSTKDIDGESLKFKKNDVLFGKLRPYLAKVIVAENEGSCTGELIIYNCKREIDPFFLKYRLLSKSYIDYVNSLTYGVKMPRVDPNQIGDIKIPFPKDKTEQIKITNYLNNETRNIDNTISVIQKRIQLLKEYKRSLINHVVTGRIDLKSS